MAVRYRCSPFHNDVSLSAGAFNVLTSPHTVPYHIPPKRIVACGCSQRKPKINTVPPLLRYDMILSDKERFGASFSVPRWLAKENGMGAEYASSSASKGKWMCENPIAHFQLKSIKPLPRIYKACMARALSAIEG